MIPILVLLAIGIFGPALLKGAPKLPGGNDGGGNGGNGGGNNGGGGNGGTYKPTSAVRNANRTLIAGWAAHFEDALNMPGLGAFLDQQAYGESRFNHRAVNKTDKGKPNAARGVFQIRPKSAFRGQAGKNVVANPQALFDMRVQIAAILRYIDSMKNYHGGHGRDRIDWLAVKRGMGYPSHVSDFDEVKERSKKVRARMQNYLGKTGHPQSIMTKRVFGPGYTWPGIASVLSTLDLTVAELATINPPKPGANA